MSIYDEIDRLRRELATAYERLARHEPGNAKAWLTAASELRAVGRFVHSGKKGRRFSGPFTNS